MKYSLAAALPTMAALAAAQGIPTNIPSCGLACIATVARDAGCAQPDDVNCLCEAYDRIAPNSQPCLEAECSDSEVDEILQGYEALCSGVSDITGSMTLPVITETDLEVFPTATDSVTVTSPIGTETSPLTTTSTSTSTTGTATDDDEETGTATDDEASPTATGEGAEEDEGSAAGRLQAAFGLAVAVAAAMAL